jgi:autotransporter-associated beta strand protein
MARLIALVFLCLCGLARAQGTYYDAPSTSVPTPPFATYVHATRLWIPNDVTVIRGVIVIGNGAGGDQRGQTAERDWQALARAHGFALMGTVGYICYFSDAVVSAEVPVLLGDLAWYATASGHPEVANLPFVFTGWSGGGQIAYGINTKIPERVIAFIVNKGANYVPEPPSAAALKTPSIFVGGEFDVGVGRTGILDRFEANRPRGALWALALEQNTGHSEGNVDGMFFTLFDHAIRARYPAGATPLNGPVTLLDLPETSGWLATKPTVANGLPGKVYPYADYTGDKTTACWLMDEGVANLYRGFATYDPAVTVTVVGGPVFNAGQTIQFNVSVDSAFFPGWVSADLYDGADKLGTVTNGGSNTISAVRPWGGRGVTAIARDAAGNERTSIPRPFVVNNAVALTNNPATTVGRTSADLSATFCPAWDSYTVTAYWGTVNGGSNPANWQHSAVVGTWSGGDATNISYAATGLSEMTPCYFTFSASKTGSQMWAPDVMNFTTVTPNAPTSSGAALSAVEDTATALAAGNFGYSDPLNVALAAIQITSLPALGTLKNGGVTVGADDLPLTVLAANIGNLTYQSASNGNGIPYTMMGMKVMNAGGLWSAGATMTLNVTSVNDAPTSTGGSVNLNGNADRTFSAGDFRFADVDAGDTLGAIQVTTLPSTGTLKINGTAINTVPSADIPLVNIGTLTYTAGPGYTASDSFTFKVRDAALFSAAATMTVTGSSTFAVLTATNPTNSTTDYLTNTTSTITNTVTAAALNSLTIDTAAGNNIWDLTTGKTATITTGGLIMTGANNFTIQNGTLKSKTASGFIVNQNGAGTLTLGSVIANGSGNSTLAKSGTGILTLSAANTYTGATTISGGILYLTNALALQNSALDTTNSVAGSNISGLKTNATTLTLGGLTGNKDLASVFTTALGGYSGVTALTLNPGPGVTNTYAGIISNGAAGMSLTKTGLGTQTLSGAHTLTSATVNAGTLGITGGSLSLANGFLQVGSAVPGIFKIDGGSLSVSSTGNNTGGLKAGNAAGNLGAIYLNSGAITTTSIGFNLHIGGVGTNIPTYGFLHITGGMLSGAQQRTRIGQFSGTGVWYQSGRTYSNTAASSSIEVGSVGAATDFNIGVVYLNNTAQFTSSTAINLAPTNIGIGTLTVAGSAALTVNNTLTAGAASGTTATVNLNGGTLTVNAIANNATGTFNFNGGTLKAGLAGALFSGTGATYVYPGGLTIDTNGNAVTITQALLAPSGSGVSTIPMTSAGSGYIGAPYISLSGDGSGATAIANMVDDATGNGTYKIDSITITCPGRGYTAITGATLSGGLSSGGTAAVLNFASATFAANAGGGLTKVGTGTLTLSNNNTYFGTTTVNEGTLAVTNTTGSGTGSGSVTVKPVATLTGTGTISGNVTIESGGFVAPGVGGIGTLTLASATLSGIYQCNLDATTCDVLVVGALTVNGNTKITFSGTPAANQYIIATYTTMIGTLPAINLPSGYYLDTATFGVIRLVKGLNPGNAPTSTGGSVTMQKNTDKTFAATDFTFADVDSGDTLGAIRVTSLPAHGTLKLAGTPITTVPSAAILVASIGNLTYTPSLNYIGPDSFKFQVRDATLFSADATMAITVNHATLIPVANGSFETTGTALGGPWFTFGSPWSITSSPSNYQVVQAVAGNFFTSTVAGGGTYIGLVNMDDCPITAPLVQNLNASVTAGDTLAVTFFIGRAKNAAGGAGVAYFDVAGTKYTMAFDTSGMTAGSWKIETMTQTITNSGNLSLGFYGTTGHTINAWVDNISNVIVTPAVVLGTYASWVATNGAGSQTMDQDHDQDGAPNGIECFLGGNSNTTGFTPLPGVVKAPDGTRSVTWIRATAGYNGVYGTDYVVQSSTTLTGAWTDEPATGGGVTLSANNVIYTFPSGMVKKFARLKVMGLP